MIRLVITVLCFVSCSWALASDDKLYLDSDYFRQGLLPYEKCKVVDSGRMDVTAPATAGLLFGVTPISPFEEFFLSCRTGQSDYTFDIPIKTSDIFHAGVMVEITSLSSLNIYISNLTGKTVSEVFGTYRGVGAGLNALLGGRVSAMINSNRAHMKIAAINGPFFGVSLGYTSLTLEKAEDYLLTRTSSGGLTRVEGLAGYRFLKVKTAQITQMP